MPLGKVFDAREGQVLSKPVSNYYGGKALRADIAIKEKQAERLQQEVDANLPEAQVRQADERIDLQKQQEDRLREMWDSEKDEAEKQKFIDVLDASEAAYQNSLAGGSSEEDARINAFDIMLAEADRLNGEGTEAEARAELEAMGFTPDLWDPVRARAALGLRPTAPKPTSKMIEAAALGYERGTPEFEAYLTESRAKPSVNDVIVPILQKTANGEELTDGEQKALDIYTRASIEERLLAAAFGGDIGELEGLNVDESAAEAPATVAKVPRTEDEVITSLIIEFANVPSGPERDEMVGKFLSIAKEATGVNLSREEAEIILDLWGRGRGPTRVRPDAESGPIGNQ
jgi:hypothetical protein